MQDSGYTNTGPLWGREIKDKISGLYGQDIQASGPELHHQTGDKEGGWEQGPGFRHTIAGIPDLHPRVIRRAADGHGDRGRTVGAAPLAPIDNAVLPPIRGNHDYVV